MQAEIYGLSLDKSKELSDLVRELFLVDQHRISVSLATMCSVSENGEVLQNESALMLRGAARPDDVNNMHKIRVISEKFPNTRVFFTNQLV